MIEKDDPLRLRIEALRVLARTNEPNRAVLIERNIEDYLRANFGWVESGFPDRRAWLNLVALIRVVEGGSMPKPCSLELRERVVNAVESGASRREAAEWFDVSPSSAIKWMQRRQATGSIAPQPSGGSISPLQAHAAFLLALIARQPDLTLDEIVAAMHKRRIAGSRSAVWRFFQRHKISFKKKPAGGRAGAGGRGAGAAALDARARHV
jgi:transposase